MVSCSPQTARKGQAARPSSYINPHVDYPSPLSPPNSPLHYPSLLLFQQLAPVTPQRSPQPRCSHQFTRAIAQIVKTFSNLLNSVHHPFAGRRTAPSGAASDLDYRN